MEPFFGVNITVLVVYVVHMYLVVYFFYFPYFFLVSGTW